ncbi:MAG: hypothetical protein GF414_08950 [Candidatus Altiarchaeales archaeon]|nr:hypothetical protein [Candidatus Altiarchaeales archaeon]
MGVLRNPEDPRINTLMAPEPLGFGGGEKTVVGYHMVRKDAPTRIVGQVHGLADFDMREKHPNPIVDLIGDRAILSPARQGWAASGRRQMEGNFLTVREAVLRHMMGEGEKRLLRLRSDGVNIVDYIDQHGLFEDVQGPAGELLTTRWTDFKRALTDNGLHIEDDGENFLRRHTVGLCPERPVVQAARTHGFFEVTLPLSETCRFGGHLLTPGMVPLENAQRLTITDPKDEQLIRQTLSDNGLESVKLEMLGK